MARSETIEVNPAVLGWLRESSGWSITEIAERLKTSPQVISELESGSRAPTIPQLRKMSSSYKCSLAAFLLPEPQPERPLPRDYRFLQGRKDVFDKKTLLAIHDSRYLQEVGRELSSNINGRTDLDIVRTDTGQDPVLVAARHRTLLGLSWDRQLEFDNARKLLNYLRDRLGDAGILVFQLSFPIEDARGFALADGDDTPFVIVLNSKDAPEARLFTIMHEFGHVLLGESAIDMPEESGASRNGIERWCNRFASAFLLPEEQFRDALGGIARDKLTDTAVIGRFSRKFNVSKAFLLRKMLDLNLITGSDFRAVLGRYDPGKHGSAKPAKGAPPPDRLCMSRVGGRFASLVADNLDRDLITYADALKYLSIRSKHLDKVLARV